MSDIPTARDEILLLIDMLRANTITHTDVADELEHVILPKLFRNQNARKAPVTSRRMTLALGRRARFLASQTNMSNAQIAAHLKINPGRVSEAINGQW